MTAVLQEQSPHLPGAAGPPAALPIDQGGELAAAACAPSPCGGRPPERPQERQDGGALWQLPERYEYRRLLGSGSYGVVCEASDVHHAHALVAIKRIPRVLENVGDGKRILREISILSKLGRSAYVVELLDVLIPGDSETFHELYLVMEHAGEDLRAFELHHHANFASGERVVKKLLRDLLLGLSHLHESGVFHRDLKPANCLVQRVHGGLAESCDEALGWRLKICDLGHARAVGSELSARDMHPASHAQAPSRHTTMARSLTCHVATRWYRAPELILLQGNYTSAVDVWSAGCIAAELFRLLPGNAACASQRGPLLPGNGCFPLSPLAADAEDLEDDSAASESRDQMALILNLVGTPSEEEMDEIASDGGSLVAKTARRYLRSFPPRAPADLLQLFPASSAEACDLLESMLRFSPHRRLRVPAALAHEFFEELPPVAEGSSCELPVVSPLDFEAEELDAARLRQLIWREAFAPEAKTPHLW